MGRELPSLSVIIPTRNRPADLDGTIQSLFQQTVLPQQLVIIDQSTSSEGRLRVDRLYAVLPDEVRAQVKLCYTLDESIPGLAPARNRAADLAEGDVWLFLDDDVQLEAKFLEELLAVYARYPRVGGVSGIVTNYRPPSLFSRFWRAIFLRGPFHDPRQTVYWKADRLHNAEPIEVKWLGGGLMSFRADAIRGCRFDENLRGISDGEDVDFCTRLKPGTILMIAPRARLVHKQSPSGRSQDHYLRRDARSEYYLYWKNWNLGLRNRVCFVWLNVGYALLATVASLRRYSLEPWRALRAGVRDAREVSHKGSKCAADFKTMA